MTASYGQPICSIGITNQSVTSPRRNTPLDVTATHWSTPRTSSETISASAIQSMMTEMMQVMKNMSKADHGNEEVIDLSNAPKANGDSQSDKKRKPRRKRSTELSVPIEQQTSDPSEQHHEQEKQNEQKPDETAITENDPKTGKDESGSGTKKGSLHMKGYGLKWKPTNKRTFRCSQCDSVKSTIQKLNAHHKRHHSPQMCGICSRTFTLAASLTRHMYDHQELQYKCEHCSEAFHFESELKSHKIKHRNKNAPSFQCMKSKCGKWFMRKWDLTLHLQKHDKEKHYCDYEGCEFWTNTSKHLNEHKKSHSDDHSHVCKQCGKGFKYRSGLKKA